MKIGCEYWVTVFSSSYGKNNTETRQKMSKHQQKAGSLRLEVYREALT